MRCDWSGYGGLLHVLRNGGVDATVMVDARRDAADEIERLNDRLDREAGVARIRASLEAEARANNPHAYEK